MENASKALLIAGGVLVALLVISLGMYIIGRAQDTAVSMEERRLQTVKQEQINKFSQYSGKIYGSEVENCIRRLATYNKDKSDDEKIAIYLYKDTPATPTAAAVRSKLGNVPNYVGDASEIINPSSANGLRIIMSPQDRNDEYKGIITYKANGMIEDIAFYREHTN